MNILTLTDNTFEKEVLQSDIPVLVDFWAEWCQPCKMVGPIVEEVAREYSGKIKVGKVNVDENTKTPSDYGIMSIPTLVIFKNGKPEQTMVGVQPKEVFKKTILIANVYCNPGWPSAWARNDSKERILWYLNKDNIACTPNNKWGTAEYFAPIANYYEVIEAGSNVGNSLVIFSRKIFGCRTSYLFAYDYCWGHGEYYGVETPAKRYLVPSYNVVDNNNDLVFTTTNMEFSAGWLDQYIVHAKQSYGVDIFNLTGRGILKQGKVLA